MEPGEFESLAGDVAGREQIGGGLLDGLFGGDMGFGLVFVLVAFVFLCAVKDNDDEAFGFELSGGGKGKDSFHKGIDSMEGSA